MQRQERGGASHQPPDKRARIQQRTASSSKQRRGGDDLSLTDALQPHLPGEWVFIQSCSPEHYHFILNFLSLY